MSSSMNIITSEVQRFQSSVKQLRSDIKDAGVNWHDEKFQKLSNMVAQIANNSKNVVVAADRFTSDVKKFESVASQN